jgi:SET domain-containing protein
MPPIEGLRVSHSKIHGYGMYTTRRFKQGETLCYADGVIYDEDDEFDDTYALVAYKDDEDPDAGKVFLDLGDQTRWINHSCQPNTYVEAKWNPETRWLTAWWVAERDIEIGEELTYDYAFVGTAAEPCACGARACRGLIVDPDPEELLDVDPALRHHLRIPFPDDSRAIG